MKALPVLLGMISGQQGRCPSLPICPELTKEKTTVTRGDEMTITCKVPSDFNPGNGEITLLYDTLGSTEKNTRKMNFHRIDGKNQGNFTFSGEQMTERVDNASIFYRSINGDCKIGEVRVVNLKNFGFFPFKSEGSKYEIDKKNKNNLVITLELNRPFDDDNFKAYKMTMNHWKDHFLLKLSNTNNRNDKKAEYYFTEAYNTFYCGDLYKTTETCQKGNIIYNEDHFKVLAEENVKEKLSYIFTIPDSNERSPTMQFEMLFGPPYAHSTAFPFKPSTISFYMSWITILLLVTFALILVGAAVLGWIYIKKYTDKQIEKGINQAERKKLLSDDRPQEAFDHIMSCMPEKEKKILKKIYIDPSKIKRDGRELGKGAFGTTRAGTLQNDSGVTTHQIAIKTMKTAISNGINGPGYAEYNSGGYPGTASSGEYFDGEHAKAIFDEAIQMSNFEHINVMKLIGVSFNRSADPEMILPLMDCGDLRNYVKNDQNEIFIRDCLRFCQQAAEGMNYLVRQGVIHRDLAARNCLLETTESNRVNLRIADFGLSKTFENLYQEEYVAQSQTKLPLKWLAIEVLEQRMFSEKSDVWAFGVLTWEIFTRGAMPYGALSDWAGLKAYLLNGERLEMPADCAPELFELMMECWHDETDKRPTFANLVSRFDQFVKDHRVAESKSGRKSSLPSRQKISFNRDHFSRTKAGYKSNRGRKMSPPVPAPRKPLPAVPDRGASLSPTHAEELV